tara:strand:+ start:299 stop:1096 length:798 start_codon:yes stop_codon:yes gene_type:complete
MTPGKGTVLTEKQAEELDRLSGLPQRTEKQELTYQTLLTKKNAPPELSDTAKSYLKELYVFHKYGKETVGGSERSKYTMKGVSVEDNSIKLLNRLDGALYSKNESYFKNEFICGTPDIIATTSPDTKKIIDIKSSWDGASLLSKIGNPLDSNYYYQVQGYMALTGATEAEIAYCLVSMPDEIINSEKKRIFYLLNPATEQNPEYLEAIEKLENNMIFDEIPEEERVVRFKVERDDAVIEKIYERVRICRLWLADFEKLHTGLNRK